MTTLMTKEYEHNGLTLDVVFSPVRHTWRGSAVSEGHLYRTDGHETRYEARDELVRQIEG